VHPPSLPLVTGLYLPWHLEWYYLKKNSYKRDKENTSTVAVAGTSAWHLTWFFAWQDLEKDSSKLLLHQGAKERTMDKLQLTG
jgi:hypothetical protein